MLGFWCSCDRKFDILTQWVKGINKKLENIMSELSEANTKLDLMDAALSDLATDVTSLAELTAQLQEQVAENGENSALALAINTKVTAMAAKLSGVDAAVEAASGVVTPVPQPEPAEPVVDEDGNVVNSGEPFFKPAGSK